VDLLHWPELAAAGYVYPADVSPGAVAAELAPMLASPDPVVRDKYAYTASARWILDGHLDEVLDQLGDTATGHFTHPEIQARTFAPLVLDCILTRATAAPGVISEATAQRWYAAFAAWYPREHDTRGWDDDLGWLHAVAHGADAAATFALVMPERRTDLLELCAQRMTAADADYRYAQLEDARLAQALTGILLVPGLTAEQATSWLTIVDDALAGGGPGAVPIWAFNTFATLQSLHLHLARGLADGGIPPHATVVAERVAGILRLPYRWLG
jgi:hypothetical protein